MDAIIFSRNSKRKNYTPLSVNRWIQARRYLIAFAILLIIHEIISGATCSSTKLFFCILKPVLMALFFMCFFLIRSYTLKHHTGDFTSKKMKALIILNDIYHIIGLCTILIVDGIETFKNQSSVETIFTVMKFLLLILFSLNSFFLLSAKICFYVIIMCFQAGYVITSNHSDTEWRIGVLIFIELAALIVIVFLLDRDKNALTSSYIDLKSQERSWRHVLEFLREGVTIIDKNGEYVYGNKFVNKILGFEPRLSELNYNVDLSKIKNMKFHADFKMPSTKAKNNNNNNTSSPLSSEGHVYEDRLLNINLERTSNLKDVLDFLRSKWINTVDLLRKLTQESGGCLHLEGETDELGIRTFVEVRITILSYEDKNNLLVALYNTNTKVVPAPVNKEIDKSRDKMIATVFHQLLHPLHGSMNYLKGAVENTLTPPTIRDVFLAPSLNSMSFLSNTVCDLVDLFHVSSNSLRMKFYGHSLLDTVKEALALIDAQAEKKGLSVIKSFKISPKLICYTDHKRLHQILLNILSTAIKFTFKGSVALTITKASYKDFMIKIEDTGIGLKDEEKRKLLDERGKIKLYSLGPSEIFGENEVGLMISNELAKKLGPVGIPDSCGIFFDSEADKGSSYQFLIEDKSYSQKSESGDHYKINIIEESRIRSHDFESDDSMDAIPSNDYYITPKFLPDDGYAKPKPLKSAKAGSSRKSVAVSTRKTNSGKKLGQCNCPEILLVDDDMFSISSLEQIMSICRFSTAACFNGMEAIREIMRRKEKKCGKKCVFLKLIFVEMSMPVMGGEEFISTVKDLMDKNEIPTIPIVGCTKYQDESEQKKARGCGAVECIVKPVTKQKVLEIFQKVDMK